MTNITNNNTYIFLNFSVNPQQTNEIDETITDATILENRVNEHASKINTHIAGEPGLISKKRVRWTPEETDLLISHIHGELKNISGLFPGRTKDQIRAKRNHLRREIEEARMEEQSDRVHTKKRTRQVPEENSINELSHNIINGSANYESTIIPKDAQFQKKINVMEGAQGSNNLGDIEFKNNGTPMKFIDKTNKVVKRIIDDSSMKKPRLDHKTNKAHWTKKETARLIKLDGQRLREIAHLFPDKTKGQISAKRTKLNQLKQKNIDDSNMKEPRQDHKETYKAIWTKEETALLIKLDGQRLSEIAHLFPDKTKGQISVKRTKLNQLKQKNTARQDGTHIQNMTAEAALTQEEKNPHTEQQDSDRRMNIDFILNKPDPMSINFINN